MTRPSEPTSPVTETNSTNIRSFVDNEYRYECLPPLDNEEDKSKSKKEKDKSPSRKHKSKDISSSASSTNKTKLNDEDLIQLLEKLPRNYTSSQEPSKKGGQTLAQTVEDLIRIDAVQENLTTWYRLLDAEDFLHRDADGRRRGTVQDRFSFGLLSHRTSELTYEGPDWS
jgi:hypothetical protein